ncbi:MAG: site-specific DNA-methyltransferase, partial [Erysipelotrichales bacterium]|nr:site-specific DNA-methyltransferase [Erysipelotrichales bacterium]
MAEKLEMMSSNIIQENIDYIASKFPNTIKEVKENGKTVKKIDIESLIQVLTNDIIQDKQERYQMTWPDKSKFIRLISEKINKTLRPIRDKSVNFETTKNIYIEGDNFETLKVLRETYLNSVKLIYVDPPYNTGDDLIYKNSYEVDKDTFKIMNSEINEDGFLITHNTSQKGRFHTDWLNMMYSRIKVAHDLLSEDGCMVFAIDHNELANLLKICDEIFGEGNRVGIVTVVHKPEGRNQEKYFATSNEFALFYAKNIIQFKFNSVVLDEEIEKTFNLKDFKGKYRLNNYIRLGGGDANLRKNKPHFYYPIYVSEDLKTISTKFNTDFFEVYPITSTQERTWKTKKETFEETLKSGDIIAEKDSKGKIVIYEKYRIDKGQLIKTHWTDKRYNAIYNGTKVLEKIMGLKAFDFPKSVYLLVDILKLITDKNSIVLDIFSGSATMAHAVMELNSEDQGTRKYIMVQLPEKTDEKSEINKLGYNTICDIGQERIRRIGSEIKAKNSTSGYNLDTGFRVLKLDSSNMNDVYYNPNSITQDLLGTTVDNIKIDRTPLDLLFQIMLELGIELSAKIEEKELLGKKYYVVN